jgi:hypothetical protein
MALELIWDGLFNAYWWSGPGERLHAKCSDCGAETDDTSISVLCQMEINCDGFNIVQGHDEQTAKRKKGVQLMVGENNAGEFWYLDGLTLRAVCSQCGNVTEGIGIPIYCRVEECEAGFNVVKGCEKQTENGNVGDEYGGMSITPMSSEDMIRLFENKTKRTKPEKE